MDPIAYRRSRQLARYIHAAVKVAEEAEASYDDQMAMAFNSLAESFAEDYQAIANPDGQRHHRHQRGQR